MIGEEKKRWGRCIELGFEVASLVVRGVTDRVKMKRLAKKQAKHVTWSKYLVEELFLAISSEEDGRKCK